MSITDHKCIATLNNYDPEPEIGERFDCARDVMGGPKKKIRMETVTTSKITKTVSKTSVLRQTVQTGGRESHLRENQIVAKGES